MLKVLAVITSILYPILIFIFLTYFDASPRVLSLLLLGIGMVYFISHTNKVKEKGLNSIKFTATVVIILSLSLLTFITENSGYVKFYPVAMNIFLLLSFSVTLKTQPSMAFRFATLADKSIIGGPDEEKVKHYCTIVTKIWVIFFIINGSIALTTALFTSYKIWTLYNGLISYILIGIIAGTEFIVRKVKM